MATMPAMQSSRVKIDPAEARARLAFEAASDNRTTLRISAEIPGIDDSRRGILRGFDSRRLPFGSVERLHAGGRRSPSVVSLASDRFKGRLSAVVGHESIGILRGLDSRRLHSSSAGLAG